MYHSGKIARLPAPIQEVVNLRLRKNESSRTLLPWLNDLPEVRRLLAERYQGQPISKQNLSQWRRGGFRDWLACQEAVAAPAANDPNLEKITNSLALRYFRKANAGPDFEGDLKQLHACCLDIIKLRRYQIQVARLKIDQRCLSLLQQSDQPK